jgi:hypothetical protein
MMTKEYIYIYIYIYARDRNIQHTRMSVLQCIAFGQQSPQLQHHRIEPYRIRCSQCQRRPIIQNDRANAMTYRTAQRVGQTLAKSLLRLLVVPQPTIDAMSDRKIAMLLSFFETISWCDRRGVRVPIPVRWPVGDHWRPFLRAL